MKMSQCVALLSLLQFFMLQGNMLQESFIPGQVVRLEVVFIENNTQNLEFKAYQNGMTFSGMIAPMSTLLLERSNFSNPITLNDRYPLVIKCSKGSYLPVFIKDGGMASGVAPEGYHGPYYASMWLPYPQVPNSSKLHVRYVVKKDRIGKIGIKIGPKGDYRLVAHEAVEFLHDGMDVKTK